MKDGVVDVGITLLCASAGAGGVAVAPPEMAMQCSATPNVAPRNALDVSPAENDTLKRAC